MDQDTMVVVSEKTQSGKLLIQALEEAGFEVQVAFWAKPTEEEKWILHLASPFFDEKGPAAAYRFVLGLLRKKPDLGIDRFEVRIIGLNDSLTAAVLKVTQPKIPESPFAVKNPKPYRGMTQFNGSTLGGVSIDGAYIYPPVQEDKQPEMIPTADT